MPTAMGGMRQGLHNLGKYMEDYASKTHQAEKRFELSDIYDLSLT